MRRQSQTSPGPSATCYPYQATLPTHEPFPPPHICALQVFSDFSTHKPSEQTREAVGPPHWKAEQLQIKEASCIMGNVFWAIVVRQRENKWSYLPIFKLQL